MQDSTKMSQISVLLNSIALVFIFATILASTPLLRLAHIMVVTLQAIAGYSFGTLIIVGLFGLTGSGIKGKNGVSEDNQNQSEETTGTSESNKKPRVFPALGALPTTEGLIELLIESVRNDKFSIADSPCGTMPDMSLRERYGLLYWEIGVLNAFLDYRATVAGVILSANMSYEERIANHPANNPPTLEETDPDCTTVLKENRDRILSPEMFAKAFPITHFSKRDDNWRTMGREPDERVESNEPYLDSEGTAHMPDSFPTQPAQHITSYPAQHMTSYDALPPIGDIVVTHFDRESLVPIFELEIAELAKGQTGFPIPPTLKELVDSGILKKPESIVINAERPTKSEPVEMLCDATSDVARTPTDRLKQRKMRVAVNPASMEVQTET